MIGDGLMGEFQRGILLQCTFLEQESGEPFVKALPHHLFHQPHHFRKPGGHNLTRIVGERRRLLHHFLIPVRRNNPERGLFFRLNHDIKLHAVQHAGRGQQTDIAVKQPVNRNFPSFIGENIRPKLTVFHQ